MCSCGPSGPAAGRAGVYTITVSLRSTRRATARRRTATVARAEIAAGTWSSIRRMTGLRRHEITRLEGVQRRGVRIRADAARRVARRAAQLRRADGTSWAASSSFACCFALLIWVWHEHNVVLPPLRPAGRRHGGPQRRAALRRAVLRLPAEVHVRFDVRAVHPDRDTRPSRWRSTSSRTPRRSTRSASSSMLLMFALLYCAGLREARRARADASSTRSISSRWPGITWSARRSACVALAIALWAPLQLRAVLAGLARSHGTRALLVGVRPATGSGRRSPPRWRSSRSDAAQRRSHPPVVDPARPRGVAPADDRRSGRRAPASRRARSGATSKRSRRPASRCSTS